MKQVMGSIWSLQNTWMKMKSATSAVSFRFLQIMKVKVKTVQC
ncbi:MAG: hypothetical protein UDO44_11455 [Prevotella sp.]|nr:hypothetical protein [Prevotella sp.]